MRHLVKLVKKYPRKFGQEQCWSIRFRANFDFIRLVQVPSGQWFTFNLLARAEETRLHQAWPKCSPNSGNL